MWTIAMFASSTTVNLMGRFIDKAGAPTAVRCSTFPLTSSFSITSNHNKVFGISPGGWYALRRFHIECSDAGIR